MKISNQFNKQHHSAILKDMFNKRDFLSFSFTGLIDSLSGQPLAITKGIDYYEMSNKDEDIKKPFTLKGYLKYLDLDYPRDENGYPKSTTVISNKELIAHQEFIRLTASINGFCLEIDEAEWNRTIELYNR